jgi:GNAT superfamily N-acetyltransferase
VAGLTKETKENDVTESYQWRVRAARAVDRAFLEAVAPRLTIGRAPWIDAEAMRATMRRFLLDDLERMGPDVVVFIAERPDGEPVGAASIERNTHFTGAPQAYLGEVVVAEEAEGRGAATALLAAAESWAREHGARLLALETGTRNTHARAFYERHGYGEESVKLVKVL